MCKDFFFSLSHTVEPFGHYSFQEAFISDALHTPNLGNQTLKKIHIKVLWQFLSAHWLQYSISCWKCDCSVLLWLFTCFYGPWWVSVDFEINPILLSLNDFCGLALLLSPGVLLGFLQLCFQFVYPSQNINCRNPGILWKLQHFVFKSSILKSMNEKSASRGQAHPWNLFRN